MFLRLADIQFPSHMSPELQDIIHAFLEKDPAERISLDDASEHVWFMKMQLKKSHEEVSSYIATADGTSNSYQPSIDFAHCTQPITAVDACHGH